MNLKTLKELGRNPSRKLAILACMDCRIKVEDLFSLNLGDAHIIRNAGGLATRDAINSLSISQVFLGTEDIIVLNHTGCGMSGVNDEDMAAEIEKQTGNSPFMPLMTFQDPAENVKKQIEILKSSGLLKKNTNFSGYLLDLENGDLIKVA